MAEYGKIGGCDLPHGRGLFREALDSRIGGLMSNYKAQSPNLDVSLTPSLLQALRYPFVCALFKLLYHTLLTRMRV